MALEDSIRKYALQNAVQFKGKANPKAIIGKIIKEKPERKKKIGKLIPTISKVVEEVNKLSLEEQREALENLAPELLEKKEKQKKDLPELENAKMGKVVTRIPPEPSKYNHLGHALSFLINYLYAQKYDGKCVVRFEDTNPELVKEEYVKAFEEDVVKFLGIKPSEVLYVSDHLEKFYRATKKLIKDNNAYACFCARNQMRNLRHEGMPCECRDKPREEHLKSWADMLAKKYKEGKCVIRLKIDMEADNHLLRDPVVMRINYSTHYRHGDKYVVWPMYDLANSLEDAWGKVTHILRSNEFGNMRTELQGYIKNLFGYPLPTVKQYGRFNVVGALTQGREIRQLIESGDLIGWDDARLMTIRALRRRGITKDAFYDLVKQVGLSPTPTNLDFTIISALNRKKLDAIAKRLFFIKDPVEVFIKDAPKQDIKLKFHPEGRRRERVFKTKDRFFLDKEDVGNFSDGMLYRLMDCLNFVKKEKGYVFDSLDHKTYVDGGESIIHWLPANDDCVEVSIMMPTGEVIVGLAEQNVTNIKENEIVQFERFGFARLDKKTKDGLVFWYTHK